MSKWRRTGLSRIVLGVFGLAIVLPGCGGGGGGGNTAGPNPEVQIVPPVDASGKPMPISDEIQPKKAAK